LIVPDQFMGNYVNIEARRYPEFVLRDCIPLKKDHPVWPVETGNHYLEVPIDLYPTLL